MCEITVLQLFYFSSKVEGQGFRTFFFENGTKLKILKTDFSHLYIVQRVLQNGIEFHHYCEQGQNEYWSRAQGGGGLGVAMCWV